MRVHPRALPSLILLLLLFVGMPAAAQERKPLTIAETVDEAALVAKLTELPTLRTRKRALVGVRFTEAGAPDSVYVQTEERVQPDVLPGLLEAVRSSLRTLPPDTAKRGISLAVATGRRAVVAAPKESTPVLLNSRAVARAISGFERKSGALPAGGTTTPLVQFTLTRDGRTEKITIRQSSGLLGVDAEAVRIAGLMRFEPAKVEDHPVPVSVTMPITFGL